MRKSESELNRMISEAVASNLIISFRTYYLSDYGEMVLKIITGTILERFGRLDLFDVVYTAAKELVINATKANLKRIVFEEQGLDANNPDDYEKGVAYLKEHLVENKVVEYRERFKERDYPVTATFYYQPNVLNIKVKNNFHLLPYEEMRIRRKFRTAQNFSNLFEFYAEHGDDSEGAGLGLTMVGILLDQCGIDKHSFVVYSNRFNETAAKLEIPLRDDYVPKRAVFQQELSRRDGLSADELRQQYAPRTFTPDRP